MDPTHGDTTDTGLPDCLSSHRSSTQIAAAEPGMAVLPVGACEQHGPHLPCDTDARMASWAARQVCARTGVLLLSTLEYGTSAEHRGYVGTMSLRPSTLAAIIEDICDSCADSGIQRVAILSAHGGNWILRPTVRDINRRHPNRTVMVVPERALWPGSSADELHAGGMETSIMLYLDPDSVGEVPPDFVPPHPREVLDALPMRAFCPDGIWGAPSTASADHGRQVLARMVEATCAYLDEEFAQICALREAAST
jgi:creatinine amidohydrolase